MSHRGTSNAGTRTVRGIRLSLVLPRSTYPANALVRVSVEARNVSSRPRLIYGTCAGPLSASVVDGRGNVVYSSAGDGQPRCGPTNLVTLAPRGKIREHVYVVLRGDRVRATVNLAGHTVHGPATFVRLTRSRGPRIVIRSRPYLHAEVRGPVRQRPTPLLYVESSACPSGSGQGMLTGGGTSGWTKIAPYRAGVFWFSPGCDHPVRWRLIAGRVGESVVTVNRPAP